MSQNSNFLSKLFDFSFTQFIALRVVGALYALILLFFGLFTLGYIFVSFTQGVSSGLAALILAPLVFLIYVILVRISLESIIVVFKIAENTSRIAQNSEKLREL
jgi:pilus assembly protein TadC